MFTIQEINTLLEALKAWEKQPTENGFSTMMLSAIFSGLGKKDEDREASMQEAKQDSERRFNKAEQDTALRSDTACLLRAKLIQMRNELTMKMANEESL